MIVAPAALVPCCRSLCTAAALLGCVLYLYTKGLSCRKLCNFVLLLHLNCICVRLAVGQASRGKNPKPVKTLAPGFGKLQVKNAACTQAHHAY